MKEYIQQLLEETVEKLKGQGVIPAEVSPAFTVERTKDKAHGDLATNLAMVAAKPAGMRPIDFATTATGVFRALPGSDLVKEVKIAGPGFINFFINSDWLAGRIESCLQDARLGVPAAARPGTVVVDYSSPNLAKEMHVGHLRSTIIGDAVSRALEFLGHRVVRQNHVGDWGTQFGMLLAHMEELRRLGSEIRMELSDLETFYRAAKARFDASEAFADRARQLVVELQSGDAYCKQLWAEFLEISLSHCQQIYDRLNVRLTRADVMGESAYNADLSQLVADLKAAGMLTEDQGAQCVFLEEFKGQDDEPLPMIVQKKDGGYLYATTDLAAIRYRQNKLGADRVLYFVDHRQSLHFQQLFAVARKAGFAQAQTVFEHMPFGTVMGEDGRPFKTRSGAVAKLSELLDEAESRAYELVKAKNTEMTEEELRHIGRVVGIASVKYADLSKNRTSDYVFSFDQMLSFEGNTAPYLLYAYTRVASIFRRAGLAEDQISGEVLLTEEVEKELAGKLTQFAEVVEKVAARGCPHLLCTYLYELSGIFSSFYQSCPVLAAEEEALRQSRLKLSLLTARVIRQGLELLGIETLERM